jgi:hypothetical protein
MKVYVYKSKHGNKLHFYDEKMKGLESDNMHDCLGTLDIPIEPEKKEVVKEKPVRVGVESFKVDGERLVEATWIPSHAYDVKLVYKVKE